MTDKINSLCKKIRETSPLIHAITNPISINLCANGILAIGAKPICAEHPKEVSEITCKSSALLLNLGNITDVRMKSIKISAKTAATCEIPLTLDAVGVACSRLRKNYAKQLIKKYPPALIKGNYSEIKALTHPLYFGRGVDAEKNIKTATCAKAAALLAQSSGALVLATGEIDILSNGEKTILIHSGTPKLSDITGTGCLLGALSATFLSCENSFDAVAAAAAFLGLCAKAAECEAGCGSFGTKLVDNINLFSQNPEKYLKSEDFYIEEI